MTEPKSHEFQFPGQECGDCQACCLPFSIDSIAKKAGSWCQHCDRTAGSKGCRIYNQPEHPDDCSKFWCGWRDLDVNLLPFKDRKYRPEKSGILVKREQSTFGGRNYCHYKLLMLTSQAQTSTYAKELTDHLLKEGQSVEHCSHDGTRLDFFRATWMPQEGLIVRELPDNFLVRLAAGEIDGGFDLSKT